MKTTTDARPTLDPVFADVYAGDLNGHPNWPAYKSAGAPFAPLAVIKATEGVRYKPAWFAENWQRMGALGLIRGAYHFWRFDSDPVMQAKWFLGAIEAAGGFKAGDMVPIIDVENVIPDPDRKPHVNWKATGKDIDRSVRAFANHIRSATGKPTLLYGIGWREKGVTNDCFGCEAGIWIARYSDTLPQNGSHGYAQFGVRREQVVAWQYQGTGHENRGRLAGYPTTVPGFAPQEATTDLSVITTTPPTLAEFQRRVCV